MPSLGDFMGMMAMMEGGGNPGAPPASADAINSHPTTTIRDSEHLAEFGTPCSVCQEEFSEGDEVRRLGCTHYFHTACVDRWLGMHNTCPSCRHPVTDTPSTATNTTAAAPSSPRGPCSVSPPATPQGQLDASPVPEACTERRLVPSPARTPPNRTAALSSHTPEQAAAAAARAASWPGPMIQMRISPDMAGMPAEMMQMLMGAPQQRAGQEPAATGDHTCAGCNSATAGLRCSRCRNVYYCNRACQRRHHRDHRNECNTSEGEARAAESPDYFTEGIDI